VQQSDWKGVLDVVGPAALEHLQSLPQRRVYPEGDHATIRAALDHGLPTPAWIRHRWWPSWSATSGRT
jgi:hypothetical protein